MQEYSLMKFSRNTLGTLALLFLSQTTMQAFAGEKQLVCKFKNQFNGKPEYFLAIDAHSKGSGKYLEVYGDQAENGSEFFVSQSPELLEEYCRYTLRAHWKGAYTAFKLDGMKIWDGEKNPLYKINTESSAEYPSFLTSGWDLSMPLPEKTPDAKPDSKEAFKKNWMIRGGIASAVTAASGTYFYFVTVKGERAKKEKSERPINYTYHDVQEDGDKNYGEVEIVRNLVAAQRIVNGIPKSYNGPSGKTFTGDPINFVMGWLGAFADPLQSTFKKVSTAVGFVGTVTYGIDKAVSKAGLYYDWKVDLAKKFEEEPEAATQI